MRPQFISFTHQGRAGYGLLSPAGIIDLSARHGSRWPTLREVIADGALLRLADEAGGQPADLDPAAVQYAIPVPAPEKIICVGVNYPDRNAEYKDGQALPTYPSLFVRFPRSFVGHGAPLILPPESAQLDYEGEVVLVIGKAGRRIREADALDHVAA